MRHGLPQGQAAAEHLFRAVTVGRTQFWSMRGALEGLMRAAQGIGAWADQLCLVGATRSGISGSPFARAGLPGSPCRAVDRCQACIGRLWG